VGFLNMNLIIRNQYGQSLVELLVAIGIFVIAVSSLAFFILDGYISGRLAEEITKANFLAEEGMEAVRSIRDNSWDGLTTGSHGLTISGNNWIFQGIQEDVGTQLKEGVRKIIVEDIDPDRKKVTSQINWQFTPARPQEIRLITYLTNWQKAPAAYCSGICTPCSDFLDKRSCNSQQGCSWSGRFKICTGTCTSCDTFLDQTSCQTQSGCTWIGL